MGISVIPTATENEDESASGHEFDINGLHTGNFRGRNRRAESTGGVR